MIKNFTIYKQSDDSRCGVACVQMILDYYKLPIPSEEEICKQLNHSYELGCTNYAIVHCLIKNGVEAVFLENCDIREIKNYLEDDEIVIIDWMKQGVGHASVVVDVDDQYVTIADPEEGCLVKMSHHDFMSQWYDWTEGYISKESLVVRGMIVATKS